MVLATVAAAHIGHSFICKSLQQSYPLISVRYGLFFSSLISSNNYMMEATVLWSLSQHEAEINVFKMRILQFSQRSRIMRKVTSR